MVDMREYGKKVHRSLLQRDLMFGVPTMGLVLVLSLAIFFLYLFRWFFMLAPLAVLFVLMRHFTSRDPWLIEIMLDSLLQQDVFIP